MAAAAAVVDSAGHLAVDAGSAEPPAAVGLAVWPAAAGLTEPTAVAVGSAELPAAAAAD